MFTNFLTQSSTSNLDDSNSIVKHFDESIQKSQDGDSIAPHKRTTPFLDDAT